MFESNDDGTLDVVGESAWDDAWRVAVKTSANKRERACREIAENGNQLL